MLSQKGLGPLLAVPDVGALDREPDAEEVGAPQGLERQLMRETYRDVDGAPGRNEALGRIPVDHVPRFGEIDQHARLPLGERDGTLAPGFFSQERDRRARRLWIEMEDVERLLGLEIVPRDRVSLAKEVGGHGRRRRARGVPHRVSRHAGDSRVLGEEVRRVRTVLTPLFLVPCKGRVDGHARLHEHARRIDQEIVGTEDRRAHIAQALARVVGHEGAVGGRVNRAQRKRPRHFVRLKVLHEPHQVLWRVPIVLIEERDVLIVDQERHRAVDAVAAPPTAARVVREDHDLDGLFVSKGRDLFLDGRDVLGPVDDDHVRHAHERLRLDGLDAARQRRRARRGRDHGRAHHAAEALAVVVDDRVRVLSELRRVGLEANVGRVHDRQIREDALVVAVVDEAVVIGDAIEIVHGRLVGAVGPVLLEEIDGARGLAVHLNRRVDLRRVVKGRSVAIHRDEAIALAPIAIAVARVSKEEDVVANGLFGIVSSPQQIGERVDAAREEHGRVAVDDDVVVLDAAQGVEDHVRLPTPEHVPALLLDEALGQDLADLDEVGLGVREGAVEAAERKCRMAQDLGGLGVLGGRKRAQIHLHRFGGPDKKGSAAERTAVQSDFLFVKTR